MAFYREQTMMEKKKNNTFFEREAARRMPAAACGWAGSCMTYVASDGAPVPLLRPGELGAKLRRLARARGDAERAGAALRREEQPAVLHRDAARVPFCTATKMHPYLTDF